MSYTNRTWLLAESLLRICKTHAFLPGWPTINIVNACIENFAEKYQDWVFIQIEDYLYHKKYYISVKRNCAVLRYILNFFTCF